MRCRYWILLSLAFVTGCSDSTTDSVEESAGEAVAADATDLTEIASGPTDAHPSHSSKEAAAHDHKPGHSHDAKKNSGHSHRGHAATERTGGIAIGEVVPDFDLMVDGKPMSLSRLRADKNLTLDGTISLTFWCSFCHSCRDVEMDLNKLASKYNGKAAVVAIDASAGETTEVIAEFAKKTGLTLPIAIDADASVADMFGIKVTTTTVVIDSKGVLRYCGQFADHGHNYAADALAALTSDTDVAVSETAHRG